MGWSCTQAANQTLQKWEELCRAQTGSQNVFFTKKAKFFFETSRTEHPDGAITGTIFKFLYPDTDAERVQRNGSFRIEADGSITTAPKILKDAVKPKPAPTS